MILKRVLENNQRLRSVPGFPRHIYFPLAPKLELIRDFSFGLPHLRQLQTALELPSFSIGFKYESPILSDARLHSFTFLIVWYPLGQALFPSFPSAYSITNIGNVKLHQL